MLSRSNQPNLNNFNFAVNSIFTITNEYPSSHTPIGTNLFLLALTEDFLLSDGTNFLLTGV